MYKFFAFVLLPQDNASTQVEVVKDDVPGAPGGKEEPHVGVMVGGDSVNRFAMFVGPKDVDLLRKVDPKLQQLIDWGWFGIIAKPIFLALHWLNDNAIHNYGWSIVVITIVINLLLLPLRFSSMKIAEKDAKAAAADCSDQCKVQGLEPARSQEGRAERGNHGPVQTGRRESDERLPSDVHPKFRFCMASIKF